MHRGRIDREREERRTSYEKKLRRDLAAANRQREWSTVANSRAFDLERRLTDYMTYLADPEIDGL